MNYNFLVISIILWLFIIFFISIIVTVEIKIKNLIKFIPGYSHLKDTNLIMSCFFVIFYYEYIIKLIKNNGTKYTENDWTYVDKDGVIKQTNIPNSLSRLQYDINDNNFYHLTSFYTCNTTRCISNTSIIDFN